MCSCHTTGETCMLLQAMQKVVTNALAACTLVNVGTVLSVSALEVAASFSFVAAGVFGLATLATWLKVCSALLLLLGLSVSVGPLLLAVGIHTCCGGLGLPSRL